MTADDKAIEQLWKTHEALVTLLAKWVALFGYDDAYESASEVSRENLFLFPIPPAMSEKMRDRLKKLSERDGQ